MPRAARIISDSGYYHVMLRKIDRQLLFKDAQDYEKFRSVFNENRSIYGIKMTAWCMMPNHVHLLIKDPNNSISNFFKAFGTSFVYWYNRKYNRTGHLFQDRFRSEPIEDSSYLLKAIRYIHMNPVKAGICAMPEEYHYSSYAYYFQSGRYSPEDELFGLISLSDFEKFHLEKNEDIFLEDGDDKMDRITDEEARRILKITFHCDDFSHLKELSPDQTKALFHMLQKRGASYSQLTRLSGFSVKEIQSLL